MMPKRLTAITLLSVFVFLSAFMFASYSVFAQEQGDQGDQVVSGQEAEGGETKSETKKILMRALIPEEEEAGVKALLSHCVRVATQELGVEGGFGDNPDAYIGVSPDLRSVVEILRGEQEGSELIDDFLFRMNRAAEASIPKVAGYFLLAVEQLKREDSEEVKADDNATAATLQLHRRMAKGLVEVVRPGIGKSIESEGAEEAYEKMLESYHDGGSVARMNFIVEDYVIEKVLEEFFVAMSEEEKALRADPSLCAEDVVCAYLTGKVEMEGRTHIGIVSDAGVKPQ